MYSPTPPSHCPGCESPFKETILYRDSEGVPRQSDIFECGTELEDCSTYVEDIKCVENQRDQLLENQEGLLDVLNQYEAWVDEIFKKLALPPGDMGALEEAAMKLHKLKQTNE